MGRVQAPVALRSSNKVDIMGKSFCLLSSLDIKPLSSCNTTRQKISKKSNLIKSESDHVNMWYSTSRVVRYPDSFLTIGSRLQVLVRASQTRPRLNRRAFRLYFLCSMHTGQPINFFPIAVLRFKKKDWLIKDFKQGRETDEQNKTTYTVINLFCSSGLVII